MSADITGEKKREQRMMKQQGCFIFTVNLGHIGDDIAELSEAEQIERLEEHWDNLLALPNVKIARGQIERNTNGVLHINGGVKFSRVSRARTLQNKWSCWADPANDEEAVLKYGTKTDTRVQRLPSVGKISAKASISKSPKQEAIGMLMDGMTPPEICARDPSVFFTHHRAIMETYKMMQSMDRFRNPQDDLPVVGEEE
jgi:hypothetical protein